MDQIRNRFKAALREGRRQVGVWCAIPDGGVVEMLAGCGYDWVLIDTEHAPIDPSGVMPLLQAAAAYPVGALVRPSWNDKVLIKRLLDRGAQTLLVPYVQSGEEAEAAAAAVRYPPRGIRGMAGSTRASRYGAVPDYFRRAHEETCLLVQVETAEALERIEEIASVDGIDGIFVGPADLAASMGHPGEPSHPEVVAASMDAIRRITAAGLPAGFLTMDQAVMRQAAEAGARYLAIGIDIAMLRQAALERRREWADWTA